MPSRPSVPLMENAHHRSGRSLPLRTTSSPQTPTSSNWSRPSMRQYASVNSLSPIHSSCTSPTHSTASSSARRASELPVDYKILVRLLRCVLSTGADEWDALSTEWWESLADEDRYDAGSRQGEVVDWAHKIQGMAKGDSSAKPRIPAFLLEAARGQDAGVRKGRAQDVVQAMLSVHSKAIDAHDAQDFLTSPPRSSRAPRPYRSIGHRAARLYGTTKGAWEAEQNW
ncbi:hypothetical protein JCM3775_001370 [Rhodotorula graminis]